MSCKICFGIPFKASKYTKALELAIKSIDRLYSDALIYILVDKRNVELSQNFEINQIDKISPNIVLKEYEGMRRGDHKQILIDWILDEQKDGIAVIMHSDVFFYKSDIVDKFVREIKDNPLAAFVCWKTQYILYSSTFHIDEKVKKCFGVAPRISTWLFAINIAEFRKMTDRHNIMRGHYWVIKGEKCKLPICDKLDFWEWFDNEMHQVKHDLEKYEVIIDIGTFLRYKWERNNNLGICLGVKENPNFNSLKFEYQSEGYVHIEQYDPERFNDVLYSKELMELRTSEIEQILKEYVE